MKRPTMRTLLCALFLAPLVVTVQTDAGRDSAQPRPSAQPAQPALTGVAAVRAAYTKFEYRIMVQVQSSWFPLTDRNPQKFVEIPKAVPSDFVKATERVFYGGADGSKITLRFAK